jgi:putative ubiquitin-RnfH superfamily antitoxin RatB of RatAB toxin-antitoxin module
MARLVVEMRVEIIYPLPHEQNLQTLDLAEGTTVAGAIEVSGLLQRYPDLDLACVKVGIFGKVAALDTVLRERDRVELYRPLIADPKAVRKQRADAGKAMKKGGGDAGAPAGTAELPG